MMEQKGNGYQGIGVIQASHLSAKIQEVTSSVAITEKMKNNNVRLQLSIPRTQGSLPDKVTPDIDGFTGEPVISM